MPIARRCQLNLACPSGSGHPSLSGMIERSPFRYFKTSPEIIRLAAMMYVCCPLSLRDVEDLLRQRWVDITHEAVRFWWNRFRTIFAAASGRCGISSVGADISMRSS